MNTRRFQIPDRAGKRTARTLVIAVLASLTLGVAGCSVFGIHTVEEARYTVESTEGNFELREYETLVVAQTLVEASYDDAGAIAFERLFGYISGDNAGGTRIAMTAPVLADPPAQGEQIAMSAPVLSERQGDAWRYRFVLPSTYTLGSAPAPTNPEVEIAVVPQSRVAALHYSGSRHEEAMRRKTGELLAWVESRGMKPASLPRSAGYDPPWTLPFLRRNEILVDIK